MEDKNKEILLFQSQEDKNFSWSAEMYIDKKAGFCFMCQGADKLDKDRIKGELWLTLEVKEVKLGDKIRKENIVNSFCQSCSKKKFNDLKNNPRLINSKALEKISSLFSN